MGRVHTRPVPPETPFPLKRLLFWSLLLPWAGTVLLGLTNPFMGFFIVLGFALLPTSMLGFVYAVGLVPSVATAAVFLVLRSRYGLRLALLLACCMAGLTSIAWWSLLDWQVWTQSRLPTWWLPYMAAISGMATLLLGFDSRLGRLRQAPAPST
jgi:hypothetical protein